MRWPSGLKAAVFTHSVWPFNSATRGAGGGLPHAGGGVARGGDDALAIGTKGGGVHPIRYGLSIQPHVLNYVPLGLIALLPPERWV